MLEKTVESVQNNRWINAIKVAIIRLAYMQLGMAMLVFTYLLFDRFISVPTEIKAGMIVLYHVFLLGLGLLFSAIVTHELTQNKQLAYVALFLMMILSVPFMMSNTMVNFIFVALGASLLFGVVLEKASRIQFETKHFPTAVSAYLTNLIPLFFGIVLAFVLSFVAWRLMGDIVWVIDGFMKVMGSWVVIVATIVAICSFWVLGVHGVAVVGTLMRPFWFYMILANGYDVLVGNPLRYIGTETYFQWFVWLGGSGCTLGLAIALRYFAKSQHLKSMSKDALFSSVYNINETLVFGTPIVDNKYFNIPFFLAPILCATIGYVAISFGYVNVPAIASPWVLPIPIGVFISTLGDYRSILLALILIAVSFLVYYPFFAKYDAMLVKQELEDQA